MESLRPEGTDPGPRWKERRQKERPERWSHGESVSDEALRLCARWLHRCSGGQQATRPVSTRELLSVNDKHFVDRLKHSIGHRRQGLSQRIRGKVISVESLEKLCDRGSGITEFCSHRDACALTKQRVQALLSIVRSVHGQKRLLQLHALGQKVGA